MDITKHPEIIDAVNYLLQKNHTVEIRIQRGKIAVLDVNRKFVCENKETPA